MIFEVSAEVDVTSLERAITWDNSDDFSDWDCYVQEEPAQNSWSENHDLEGATEVSLTGSNDVGENSWSVSSGGSSCSGFRTES